MKRNWLLIAIGLLAAVLALGAIACGDNEEEGDETPAAETPAGYETPAGETPAGDETPAAEAGAVNVDLLEYQVVPDVESVAAGSVTFNASNIGGAEHELVIVLTDLAPDALPTLDDGSFDEEGEGVEVIDKIGAFEPGGEESIASDLETGPYVLLCNVVDDAGAHYALGMTIAFEVTE